PADPRAQRDLLDAATDKRELLLAFTEMRPHILGALFDAVRSALRNLQTGHLGRAPRLAGFARWVTATKAGLGRSMGTVMRAHGPRRQPACRCRWRSARRDPRPRATACRSWVLARAVRLVRRKEGDRLVTPVVDVPGRGIVSIELEHWHQFNCGHAHFLQIRNHLDQTGKGAASVLRDAGTRMTGEPTHMQFVDDSPRGGPIERPVAFPIVRLRIRHHTFPWPSRNCRLPSE